MPSAPTFSDADRQRFAQIKAELAVLLPDTRPRSEAVHRCALLFIEVRDKGYQTMDGHEHCEVWMVNSQGVGQRQAGKYFNAATIPADEVAGKRQGIEVMDQIGQEQDAQVRLAMWELAEKEGASERALCKGRQRLHRYLKKGRRKQGIEALRREARKRIQEELAEKEEKARTRRTAGERGAEELASLDRLVDGLLSGKGEASPDDIQAMMAVAEGLAAKVRRLAEHKGIARKSPTSEGPPPKGGEAPSPPTEGLAPEKAAVITRPAAADPTTTAPAAQTGHSQAQAGHSQAQAQPQPQAQAQAQAPAPARPQAPVRAPVADDTPAPTARAAVSFTGAVLQLPAEVLAFRPLFRYFHEELTPGRQDCVQFALCAVVRGSQPDHRIHELYQDLRPFLPSWHPMKKPMARLAAGLRAQETGRRFALYCLIAARLPGLAERLEGLLEAKLPAGLRELVLYYRNLILGMS